MGYTHYWRSTGRPITDDEWDGFTEAVRKVFKKTDVPIAYEYDDPGSAPAVSDTVVWFNGVGDDGHETFYIPRVPEGFNFCKTAQKPYDTVVVAVLCLADHFFPDSIMISSDGDHSDWTEGYALARDATGLELKMPDLFD